MLSKIIHIPHTSNYIPSEYISDYLISKDDLEKECEIMRDTYIDIITDNIIETEEIKILKFNYSRIFCDVERFNNETEVMNKIGMGILYTKSHDLKIIRTIKNKNGILEIYNNYHKQFNDITKKLLNDFKKVLILDIHSYSNDPLPYELYKNLNRPDVCIGFDDYHVDKNILNNIIDIIKSANLTYSLNEPFKGSIVPMEFYNKNKNIYSIMLDFNKKSLGSDLEGVRNIFKKILKI